MPFQPPQSPSSQFYAARLWLPFFHLLLLLLPLSCYAVLSSFQTFAAAAAVPYGAGGGPLRVVLPVLGWIYVLIWPLLRPSSNVQWRLLYFLRQPNALLSPFCLSDQGQLLPSSSLLRMALVQVPVILSGMCKTDDTNLSLAARRPIAVRICAVRFNLCEVSAAALSARIVLVRPRSSKLLTSKFELHLSCFAFLASEIVREAPRSYFVYLSAAQYDVNFRSTPAC